MRTSNDTGNFCLAPPCSALVVPKPGRPIVLPDLPRPLWFCRTVILPTTGSTLALRSCTSLPKHALAAGAARAFYTVTTTEMLFVTLSCGSPPKIAAIANMQSLKPFKAVNSLARSAALQASVSGGGRLRLWRLQDRPQREEQGAQLRPGGCLRPGDRLRHGESKRLSFSTCNSA